MKDTEIAVEVRAETPKALRLADCFPEQNPRNFDYDAAVRLNEWGIDAVTELRRLSSVNDDLNARLEAIEAGGADPAAWRIQYNSPDGFKKTVLHGHNAIGDYRMIDPKASSVPLYAAPQPHQIAEPARTEQLDDIADSFETAAKMAHLDRVRVELCRADWGIAAACIRATTPKEQP